MEFVTTGANLIRLAIIFALSISTRFHMSYADSWAESGFGLFPGQSVNDVDIPAIISYSFLQFGLGFMILSFNIASRLLIVHLFVVIDVSELFQTVLDQILELNRRLTALLAALS